MSRQVPITLPHQHVYVVTTYDTDKIFSRRVLTRRGLAEDVVREFNAELTRTFKDTHRLILEGVLNSDITVSYGSWTFDAELFLTGKTPEAIRPTYTVKCSREGQTLEEGFVKVQDAMRYTRLLLSLKFGIVMNTDEIDKSLVPLAAANGNYVKIEKIAVEHDQEEEEECQMK